MRRPPRAAGGLARRVTSTASDEADLHYHSTTIMTWLQLTEHLNSLMNHELTPAGARAPRPAPPHSPECSVRTDNPHTLTSIRAYSLLSSSMYCPTFYFANVAILNVVFYNCSKSNVQNCYDCRLSVYEIDEESSCCRSSRRPRVVVCCVECTYYRII